MTKLISPAPGGWKGIGFGYSGAPYSASNTHRGQDWGFYNLNPSDSKRVVAPINGVIESVYSGGGYNQGWGNRVVIRVSDRVTVTLNHLATGSIAVSQGQYVNAGTYIGQMGATGNVTGVHLHEEFYLDGSRVDPEYYRNNDVPGTVTGSGASNGSQPVGPSDNKEFNDMFIAIDPSGGWWLIVPNGAGKPRAVILGANAIVSGTGNTPVIKFEWEPSFNALKGAVDGM